MLKVSFLKRFFLLFLVGIFLAGFLPSFVFAAYVQAPIGVPPGVRDALLSPAKVELEISPGERKTVTLSVQNRTGKRLRFTVGAEDVAASKNEADQIQLLGKKEGQFPLKNFLSFEDKIFELDSGQVAFIPVSVNLPRGTLPGGRYGAVTFTASDSAESPAAGSGARVSARLAALFFVKIPGVVNEAGVLEDFSTASPQSGPPSLVLLRMLFNNTGTVYLNPYGKVTIRNAFGAQVAEIPIDPWFVLPDSQRVREVPWQSDAFFARYTATLELNRGYEDLVDQKTVSFWVVTPEGGFLATLFLVGVVFCMQWIVRKRMRG